MIKNYFLLLLLKKLFSDSINLLKINLEKTILKLIKLNFLINQKFLKNGKTTKILHFIPRNQIITF